MMQLPTATMPPGTMSYNPGTMMTMNGGNMGAYGAGMMQTMPAQTMGGYGAGMSFPAQSMYGGGYPAAGYGGYGGYGAGYQYGDPNGRRQKKSLCGSSDSAYDAGRYPGQQKKSICG